MLRLKDITSLKWIKKIGKMHIHINRKEDEVTVDVGGFVITGKSETIMKMLNELPKL